MRNTFTIHDDQVEEYEGKKGKQTIRILTLIDASPTGAKLKQMCDLSVPETFIPLRGGAVGQAITVDITEITIFSGRPRLRGVIVAQKLPPIGGSPAPK
jgi:hypothetical protein